MVVEYFGIPGSGKTYKANQYKSQLKDTRIKYVDISRHSGMPLWLKVFYKLADFTICIVPKYRELIREISAIDSRREPRFLMLSKDYCIKDIVLSIFLQDLFIRCKKEALNDEGILQRIATFSVLYSVDINALLDSCKHNITGVRHVFVDISIEDAYRNIRFRNRHVCQMDEMSDDILMGYLEAFNLAFNAVQRWTSHNIGRK